jgi:hypothetical protein
MAVHAPDSSVAAIAKAQLMANLFTVLSFPGCMRLNSIVPAIIHQARAG